MANFRRFRDVMSLRASFCYFYDLINGMLLHLTCYLSYYYWFEMDRYQELINLTDFMKSDTNWRFKSPAIQDFHLFADFDILPFLV